MGMGLPAHEPAVIMLCKLCWATAMLSQRLGVHAAGVDYATKMQQTVGSASIAAKDRDFPVALRKLDQLQELLTAWKGSLQEQEKEKSIPAEPVEIPKPPEESIEFSINRTFVPEKCKRFSELGSTMRVHYVGKVIKTKKIFASSFHTGSTPLRFILGSDEVVPSWNKGLLDMCEGERRRLMVPWDMAYGAKGDKGVPPYSDLQYDLELVEVSAPKRTSKAKANQKKEL